MALVIDCWLLTTFDVVTYLLVGLFVVAVSTSKYDDIGVQCVVWCTQL